MMKNKLASTMLAAAALTALAAFPASAAAPAVSAVPKAAVVTITAAHITDAQGESMENGKLQKDKNGSYFVTEQGQKVYFTLAQKTNEANITLTPAGK